MALNSSQQEFINTELARYRKVIADNPEVFQTQASRDQFYDIIRSGLGLKVEAINGLISEISGITGSGGTGGTGS